MVGCELDAGQVDRFMLYMKELLEWNTRMNLTAITQPAEVVEKHFLDSLLGLSLIRMAGEKGLIDVGTGAGFPGLPLYMVMPQIKLTLMDSQQKRIGFLRHLMETLKLDRVQIVHARAEEAGRHEGMREYFQVAVARAVAPMAVLAELCLPLVRTGGMMVAWKGPDVEKELQDALHAIAMLGGGDPEVYAMRLPFSGDARRLVVVPKVRTTPAEYPRRPGIPEKRPLRQPKGFQLSVVTTPNPSLRCSWKY